MRKWTLFVATGCLLTGGCLAPTAVYKTMNMPGVDAKAAFDTTLAVLRQHFEIQQVDREAGVIETQYREQSQGVGVHSVPLAAARPGRLGEDLMILRRKAQAKVLGVGNDTRVKLRVVKEREKAQEHYENVVFQEYDPMTPARPHIIDPRADRRGRIWRPLGSDEQMEEALLRDIAKKLEVPFESITIY